MQFIYYKEATPTTGISQPHILARKRVRNQLRGTWQLDEDFFQKFFPVNAHARETSSQTKAEFYHNSADKRRWSGIPQDPKSVNSRLYTGLNNLLNGILPYFLSPRDHKNPRLFIKTYRRKVLPILSIPIWPGILLAGAGTCFLRATSNRPTSDYRFAISPLEIVLENSNTEIARQRLATVVQQVFDSQPNRRFVFGLVMSSSTLTCCLFDHSGVVFSPPLDYHAQPDQFCALIAGLVSSDATRLGFDPTIFMDEVGVPRIDTRGSGGGAAGGTQYVMYDILHYAPRLIGRGTFCVLARRIGDQTAQYVIKDAWISMDEPELEGRDSEASLLFHAQSRGVVQGVAQICYSEEVHVKGTSGRLVVDDIYNTRRLEKSDTSLVRQRVHTRIIMSTYGKPLEAFSSRKELILAYYDAVQAHRNLYENAGILHRDIKPGNILINPGGAEGERGIVIDFDHAIRTDNVSPYANLRKIGTYLFMSSSALEGKAPHGYLDDLESFYYVLVYMVTLFKGPSSVKRYVPLLDGWKEGSAASQKRGHFYNDSPEVEVEPWFGAPFRDLIQRLHTLLGDRLVAIRLAERAKKPLPLIDPMKESDEFISHIRQTIVELEQEAPLPPDPISKTKSYMLLPKGLHTVAGSRSLRPNVNYDRVKKT